MIPLKKSKYDNVANKFWVVFGNDYFYSSEVDRLQGACKFFPMGTLYAHLHSGFAAPPFHQEIESISLPVESGLCLVTWFGQWDISTHDPSRGLKKCLCTEVHLLLLLRTLLLSYERVWASFLEDVRPHGERLPTVLVEAPDMWVRSC